MPINDLATLTEPPPGFVVLGGGKTSMDACLWLLEQGVDPQRVLRLGSPARPLAAQSRSGAT